MFGDQAAGRAVQVAGPAIVSQPFPQAQNLLFLGGRQIGNRREGDEKTLEIGNHGGDLGLLQHDLADPDAIGIAVGSPGERALPSYEPGEQRTPEPLAKLRGGKLRKRLVLKIRGGELGRQPRDSLSLGKLTSAVADDVSRAAGACISPGWPWPRTRYCPGPSWPPSRAPHHPCLRPSLPRASRREETQSP